MGKPKTARLRVGRRRNRTAQLVLGGKVRLRARGQPVVGSRVYGEDLKTKHAGGEPVEASRLNSSGAEAASLVRREAARKP